MYKLVYNYRETKGREVIEREYNYSDEFRLKRNAIHYLREIVQSDYREMGYATGLNKSNELYCINSEISAEGERIVKEWVISVKKV